MCLTANTVRVADDLNLKRSLEHSRLTDHRVECFIIHSEPAYSIKGGLTTCISTICVQPVQCEQSLRSKAIQHLCNFIGIVHLVHNVLILEM